MVTSCVRIMLVNRALSTSTGTYPIDKALIVCPVLALLRFPTRGRFSLLLLEFGEVYLEDFGVIYYPAAPTEAETIERRVTHSCTQLTFLTALIEEYDHWPEFVVCRIDDDIVSV